MFKPMKITFHMDGTGLFYDPSEPIMLDGLLAAAVCRFHVHGEPPARDEEPAEIPLPLQRWQSCGAWGWHASALLPDGPTAESLQFWRKRFRQNRVELTSGSPNLTNGCYRDWNMPIPLLLTPRMVAYAVGNVGRVRRELRRSIKYLGKKRAHGRGAVVGIDVEEIDRDYSLVGPNGETMRYMPTPGAVRLIRPRPPYWSSVGCVPCCEIGVAQGENERVLS
jgi:CRISPR type IV-associated protein Csf3